VKKYVDDNAGGGGWTPPWDADTFDGTEDSDRSDQFDDASFDAGKWTKFQDTDLTWTEENTWLKIRIDASTANGDIRGFFKLVDSGSWTVTAKLGFGFSGAISANECVAIGIMVLQDATNNPDTCDIYVNTLGWYQNLQNIRVNIHKFSDYDTYVSSPMTAFSTGAWIPVAYQRLVWDETDLRYFVSPDGISWTQIKEYTPDFTPAEFGIVVRQQNSNMVSEHRIHWVTYHNSDLGTAPCGGG